MAAKDERAERLRAALRANLRRRKAPVAPDDAGHDGPAEEDQRRTAIDPRSAAADAAS